ncbi:MAG: hypothetical protein IJT68_08855 [Lentisphaeria bacterium]|nr:hypothetical protein [Lentisphaeria bacterium]MDD6338299.1 hypothetical protein [Lentisphaeria bacterium]
MIWLEADERIETKEQFEEKKIELQIRQEQATAILNSLVDLKQIGLAQIPFASETEAIDFIYRLPSNKGARDEERKNLRWTMKRRKPGEIPAWKKQRQNQDNNCQKTG